MTINQTRCGLNTTPSMTHSLQSVCPLHAPFITSHWQNSRRPYANETLLYKWLHSPRQTEPCDLHSLTLPFCPRVIALKKLIKLGYSFLNLIYLIKWRRYDQWIQNQLFFWCCKTVASPDAMLCWAFPFQINSFEWHININIKVFHRCATTSYHRSLHTTLHQPSRQLIIIFIHHFLTEIEVLPRTFVS